VQFAKNYFHEFKQKMKIITTNMKGRLFAISEHEHEHGRDEDFTR